MTGRKRSARREIALALAVAVGLAYYFWTPLWHGAGLIGGDIYTYYFPQKMFLADRLAEGELPLWNSRVGHGYPLVAESQTAPFYPANLIAYRLFDVNTAYNAVQLLHYVLAFVFTWLYVRRLGYSAWAGALAALVYTYGWFPVRMYLEWAIIGGAWLPLALWSVESYLWKRLWRYPILLSVTIAMQLFAGHFNLAFITLLVLAAYIPGRLWLMGTGEAAPRRVRTALVLFAAAAIAFPLAAMQLLPTWELKAASQRAAVNGEFTPAYGRIPLGYLTEIVAPWLWYGTDPNSAIPPGGAPTNRVEAHLYFGWLTLVLVAAGLCLKSFRKDRRVWLWAVLEAAALVYATGVLVPVTKHLPGFSYFMGPGRFGIVTTLAVGVLAGAAFDQLMERVSAKWATIAAGAAVLAFAVIAYDLEAVGRDVRELTGYAIVERPPLEALPESPVRRLLAREEEPVRLFARGPNLPTLLGVASTPPYLGIGPNAYFDSETTIPGSPPFDESPTDAQVDWLRRAGVTHVLSFHDLADDPNWPVEHVWTGYDRFLNPAWARREPLYLYRLLGTRGRVAWLDGDASASAKVTEYRANRVTIEAEPESGGRLILTDLAYPGWSVQVDGEPAEETVIDGMYRGVEVPAGRHTVVWTYAPASFYWGVAVSSVTALLLAGFAHVCFWRPQWLARLHDREALGGQRRGRPNER